MQESGTTRPTLNYNQVLPILLCASFVPPREFFPVIYSYILSSTYYVSLAGDSICLTSRLPHLVHDDRPRSKPKLMTCGWRATPTCIHDHAVLPLRKGQTHIPTILTYSQRAVVTE